MPQKTWIELHVKCLNETEDNERLREMGVPSKGSETEYRRLCIRPEQIEGYYENADGGCFLVAMGAEYSVQESYDELFSFILKE
ncbi:unnamed protein product [marine sediment metagenome]|uniref:Uncharacterized protein n=1 Tax=marine sediment metagenome TaxID=412755 RepID=X0X379_9ZZZZ